MLDPLQERIVAVREGIVLGFFDRVGSVAPGVVDVGDGVTGGAGDTRLTCRVMDVVVVGIVKFAREEWHGILQPAHQRAACVEPSRASATLRVSRTLVR